jgi:hypothetical protein
MSTTPLAMVGGGGMTIRIMFMSPSGTSAFKGLCNVIPEERDFMGEE